MLILVLTPFSLPAQDATTKPKKYRFYNTFQPKIQYEYFGYHNFSVGISDLKSDNELVTQIPWSFQGGFLDIGVASKNGTNLFSSKIGYEYFFLIFGGRLNIVNFTDFNRNQTCIRPEIGISLFSYLTFTYGYNFNLNKTDFFDVKGNVFCVNIGYIIEKKK